MKLCDSCGAVGLNPAISPICYECGGPLLNCKTCGTGKRWWIERLTGFTCPECKHDPFEEPPLPERVEFRPTQILVFGQY